MSALPWISTADRLPEPDTLVLGWFEYGDEQYRAVYFDPEAFDDADDCWMTAANVWLDAPPSHWMPLCPPTGTSHTPPAILQRGDRVFSRRMMKQLNPLGPRPSASFWLRRRLNRKPAMRPVPAALLFVLPALKNRYMAALVAHGAHIVRRLSFGAVLFAAIHERTGWRLPRFIAVKLFKFRVKLHQRLLMLGQAYLKRNIRLLRIQYLLLKLDEGGFDINFALDLRKVEKALESGRLVSQPADDRVPVLRKPCESVDALEPLLHGHPPLRLSRAVFGNWYKQDAAS